ASTTSELVLSGELLAVSGEPYSFTVTAQLLGGGTDASYRGRVHFTSSDATSLPADYTFTADDQGSHTFAAVFRTLGPQSLTATDSSNGITGTLPGIVVSAPQASSFVVAGYPSPVGRARSTPSPSPPSTSAASPSRTTPAPCTSPVRTVGPFCP